jgi:hypothetical protein
VSKSIAKVPVWFRRDLLIDKADHQVEFIWESVRALESNIRNP